MPLKKMTTLALFTTLSLAIYAVESVIPPLVPIPGIKLGLANIITLILLQYSTLKDAALVLAARILLSSLLFGQLVSLAYSLVGGIFSLLVMFLISRLLHKKFPFLTGAAGGLSHNIGQLLVAFFLTATPGIMAYLPFLVLSGIITGFFTGLVTTFLPPVFHHLDFQE